MTNRFPKRRLLQSVALPTELRSGRLFVAEIEQAVESGVFTAHEATAAICARQRNAQGLRPNIAICDRFAPAAKRKSKLDGERDGGGEREGPGCVVPMVSGA